MKFFNSFLTATCILTTTVLFSSCKKEASLQSRAVSEEETYTITQENTTADAQYDDVTEMGLTAAADLEASASASQEVAGTTTGTGLRIRTNIFKELALKLGACTEVTVSGDSFPTTVVVNYGEGCLCRDGKFRQGAVELRFSGPLRRPGSILTINFRNYSVNRARIEGTKTITNLSAGGVHKFSVNLEKGKIDWPNGRGFTYEGKKVIIQVSGVDSKSVSDDVYEITGDDKTIYANGVIVIKSTETPLIKRHGCSWLAQGTLKITINERNLFVNYGTGACDNKALLSWSGGNKEITLHQ